jgi:hypothetical protein
MLTSQSNSSHDVCAFFAWLAATVDDKNMQQETIECGAHALTGVEYAAALLPWMQQTLAQMPAPAVVLLQQEQQRHGTADIGLARDAVLPALLTCNFFAALAVGNDGSAGLGNSLALSTTVDRTVADAASTVRSILSNACFKRSIAFCCYSLLTACC